jgi:FkbM family methyltransferase
MTQLLKGPGEQQDPTFSIDSPDLIQYQKGEPLMRMLQSTTQDFVISKSKTDPPFIFTGPESQPIFDYMRRNGVWGPMETQIFKEVCNWRCDKSKSIKSNPLVIDVGGNIGMFTLFSASMGCRVQTYEPIPGAFYFMRLSVLLNGFEDNIQTNNKAIDEGPGETVIEFHGDWGVGNIKIVDKDKDFENEKKKANNLVVKTTGLSQEIKEDVLLLKVDVEGFEDNVFKGLLPVFDEYSIENIILEVKKNRDYRYKADFLNKLRKEYIILSFKEDYSQQGLAALFVDMDCIMLSEVKADEWIPWEDIWLIKIGSPTYKKAINTLNCLK